MATIIQIKGADFSGKGLPKIVSLFTEGLVSAFRPSVSLENTIDLANNGTTLTQVGNPTFEQNYVVCSNGNGFALNINETESVTILAVVRSEKVSESYQVIIGGTYTGGRGLSMYHTNAGVTAQTFSKKISDGTYVNETKRVVDIVSPNPMTDWILVGMVVDAVNNKLMGFSSTNGLVDLSNSANNYADRDGLNRAFNLGKFAYTPASGYPANIHIAEFLVYDKALTVTELQKVLSISRSAMSLKSIYI